MANIDISPLLVVSQKVMLNFCVLSAAVFNGIIRQADCTLIIMRVIVRAMRVGL
jgi:hypothetical protein